MHRGHLKNIKMKKTIISILAFVAITLQSFAEEKKKHIGFSLGVKMLINLIQDLLKQELILIFPSRIS